LSVIRLSVWGRFFGQNLHCYVRSASDTRWYVAPSCASWRRLLRQWRRGRIGRWRPVRPFYIQALTFHGLCRG
jgi:hypothetical protein